MKKNVSEMTMKCSCLPRRLLLLSLVLLVGRPTSVTAQGAVTWSEPFNLSNSPTSSAHPAIVADAYGCIHVFWSEDMEGRTLAADELLEPGNTILYRYWDGQSWTDQRDILAVSGDSLADFVAATVDNMNRLHVVWTGLTNLYYSTAPAAAADSPWAWSTPQMISADSARSQWESDVATDSQGNVHIVYAEGGRRAGVLYTMAPAGGAAWTQPTRISDDLRPTEFVFKTVRLIIDTSDHLHAVWGTTNTNGYDQAVYYARSEGAGQAWSPPILLDDATIDTGFTGLPYLVNYGQDDLLLIHVGQGITGRIERTSSDGGRTWSEPRTILSSMQGVNGFLIPLVDSMGNLHLIINMRPTADQRVGIYYAPRAGLDWGPIHPVVVEEPYGPSAHYVDAAVRLGNQIHVVWTQLRGGEIWYVRGEISGVPEDPALVLPTQTPRAATTVTVTTPRAEPTETHHAAELAGAAPSTTLPFHPLLLGGLTSALVVLFGLLWTRARSR